MSVRSGDRSLGKITAIDATSMEAYYNRKARDLNGNESGKTSQN